MAGTGLSAAALLGCGSDESETAPTTAQPAPAAPAAPANGVAAPAPGTIPDGVLMPRVAGAPTYGGTFNDGVAFTNAVHDMHTAGAGTVWHVLGGRGMRLGAFSGELEAEMVEEWEVVDDQGLELLMHVRPGMALHDKEPWNGRDFNAEDLARTAWSGRWTAPGQRREVSAGGFLVLPAGRSGCRCSRSGQAAR